MTKRRKWNQWKCAYIGGKCESTLIWGKIKNNIYITKPYIKNYNYDDDDIMVMTEWYDDN